MTHFELLKYAATGIASPGMTAYDKMRALAMGGGKVKTLTGVPPLSFKANGKPLISWSMKGNGQQNGTPTPDAPIMPQFVGDRTANLFDIVAFAENSSESHATIARNGNTIILTATAADAYVNQIILDGNTTPAQYQPPCISVEPETEYTIYLSKAPKCYISWINDSFLAVANFTRIPSSYTPTSYTFTTPAGCTKILLRIGQDTTIGATIQFSDIMLVKGSTTPSSYIPYGYSIQTSSSTQNTVSGQTPLTLTDSVGHNLISTQAGVTIPTAKGNATLTTSNTVQPSTMHATYDKYISGGDVPMYLGQVLTTRRVKKLVLDGTENWSTQNVGPHCAVSIRKDELPLTPNMQVGTLNILSTHFKSIGDVSQLDVGKMASGSSYLNFDYDGINNVTNFKSFLAAQYAAGTPVTIWYVLATPETGIVNEPLCKIGDYADELHSEDAAVTIPTAKGENTLTVDTDLQPSEMTITYRE